MLNLGTINGKVEILVDGKKNVTLVATCNVISLTNIEALDLGDVISYAATGELDSLPVCESFRRNEKVFPIAAHASDCAYWSKEDCTCLITKRAEVVMGEDYILDAAKNEQE